jgi:glutathione S-transferase
MTMSPYGDFDLMLGTILERLANSPYLLGDVLSAADLLWGMALRWGTMFKLIPESPTITNYVARVTTRASFAKVTAMEIEWAAEHERVVKEIKS